MRCKASDVPNPATVTNAGAVGIPASCIKLEETPFIHVASMRFLFFLVLLANVAVLAYGQGFMGVPPSEQGRTPRMLSERNQHIVEFGPPRLVVKNGRAG